MMTKTPIADQSRERLHPDHPVAEVGMAIHPAAERHLAVIDVEGEETMQSDHLIKGTQGLQVCLFGSQGVASREYVAGVQTDADMVIVIDQAQQRTEMLETVSD